MVVIQLDSRDSTFFWMKRTLCSLLCPWRRVCNISWWSVEQLKVDPPRRLTSASLYCAIPPFASNVLFYFAHLRRAVEWCCHKTPWTVFRKASPYFRSATYRLTWLHNLSTLALQKKKLEQKWEWILNDKWMNDTHIVINRFGKLVYVRARDHVRPCSAPMRPSWPG